MVSSVEERYLSSAGLSPLRTHFFAILKMPSLTITYSGYCHPLSPYSSTTTLAQNLHCVPIHFKKGQKFLINSLWKYLYPEGHGEIFFKKKREENDEKKYPWSLAKDFKRGVQIKWPKTFPKVWVHFSLSPGHLWFHKIGIWSSTYLLRTTLRLGNTGNQGMSHSSYP